MLQSRNHRHFEIRAKYVIVRARPVGECHVLDIRVSRSIFSGVQSRLQKSRAMGYAGMARHRDIVHGVLTTLERFDCPVGNPDGVGACAVGFSTFNPP